MKIVLFSNDERLAAFCTEILTETFGGDSKLEMGVPGQPDSGEDLCLWDFIPGETSFPKEFETGRLSGTCSFCTGSICRPCRRCWGHPRSTFC